MTDPKKYLNYLAIFVVILNFTNIYTMISGFTAISFKQLSASMMAVLLLNSAVNIGVLGNIFSKKLMTYFFIFFVIIPALGVFISPHVLIRYFWYYILSGLIFINVCLFIKKEGSFIFKQLILCCFGITIVGVLMSYYFPHIFASIGEMQARAKGTFGIWDTVKVGSSSHARAFGFYMQPNIAYTSILFQLIILATSFFNRSVTKRVMLYGVSFFCILLTGSRGGFLMFCLFIMIILFTEMKNGARNKRNRIISFPEILPYYLGLGVLLISVVVAVNLFAKQSSKGEGINVVEKIYHTFFPGSGDASLLEDQSVSERMSYQVEYLNMLGKNPRTIITGYGTGSAAYYRYTGDLPNASHNNFLEKTFSHGIFASLGMYLMFIFACRSKLSNRFKAQYGYNISFIITICIFIQSFTINTLFSYRLLPVLVGFWLMSLYYPNDSSQKRFS